MWEHIFQMYSNQLFNQNHVKLNFTPGTTVNHFIIALYKSVLALQKNSFAILVNSINKIRRSWYLFLKSSQTTEVRTFYSWVHNFFDHFACWYKMTIKLIEVWTNWHQSHPSFLGYYACCLWARFVHGKFSSEFCLYYSMLWILVCVSIATTLYLVGRHILDIQSETDNEDAPGSAKLIKTV